MSGPSTWSPTALIIRFKLFSFRFGARINLIWLPRDLDSVGTKLCNCTIEAFLADITPRSRQIGIHCHTNHHGNCRIWKRKEWKKSPWQPIQPHALPTYRKSIFVKSRSSRTKTTYVYWQYEIRTTQQSKQTSNTVTRSLFGLWRWEAIRSTRSTTYGTWRECDDVTARTASIEIWSHGKRWAIQRSFLQGAPYHHSNGLMVHLEFWLSKKQLNARFICGLNGFLLGAPRQRKRKDPHTISHHGDHEPQDAYWRCRSFITRDIERVTRWVQGLVHGGMQEGYHLACCSLPWVEDAP